MAADLKLHEISENERRLRAERDSDFDQELRARRQRLRNAAPSADIDLVRALLVVGVDLTRRGLCASARAENNSKHIANVSSTLAGFLIDPIDAAPTPVDAPADDRTEAHKRDKRREHVCANTAEFPCGPLPTSTCC